MRKHFVSIVAACTIALSVGQAMAQDDAPRPGGRQGARRGERRAGRGNRGERGKQRLDRLVQELKLTEKQQAPVRQVLETHQKDMAAWMRENGPAMREIRVKLGGRRGRRGRPGAGAAAEPAKPAESAKPATDAEQKEARAKLQVFNKERAAKMENLFKQLKDHLTEAQMVTARRLLGPRGGRGMGPMFEGLDLSDEQKAKIKTIMDAARAKARQAQDREARRAVMQEARKKIADEVLTDEQGQKLQEGRKRMQERRRQGRGQRGARRGRGATE